MLAACRTNLRAQLPPSMSMSRADIGISWKQDSDKPLYHVMPRDGWLYVLRMPFNGEQCSFSCWYPSILALSPKGNGGKES